MTGSPDGSRWMLLVISLEELQQDCQLHLKKLPCAKELSIENEGQASWVQSAWYIQPKMSCLLRKHLYVCC